VLIDMVLDSLHPSSGATESSKTSSTETSDAFSAPQPLAENIDSMENDAPPDFAIGESEESPSILSTPIRSSVRTRVSDARKTLDQETEVALLNNRVQTLEAQIAQLSAMFSRNLISVSPNPVHSDDDEVSQNNSVVEVIPLKGSEEEVGGSSSLIEPTWWPGILFPHSSRDNMATTSGLSPIPPFAESSHSPHVYFPSASIPPLESPMPSMRGKKYYFESSSTGSPALKAFPPAVARPDAVESGLSPAFTPGPLYSPKSESRRSLLAQESVHLLPPEEPQITHGHRRNLSFKLLYENDEPMIDPLLLGADTRPVLTSLNQADGARWLEPLAGQWSQHVAMMRHQEASNSEGEAAMTVQALFQPHDPLVDANQVAEKSRKSFCTEAKTVGADTSAITTGSVIDGEVQGNNTNGVNTPPAPPRDVMSLRDSRNRGGPRILDDSIPIGSQSSTAKLGMSGVKDSERANDDDNNNPTARPSNDDVKHKWLNHLNNFQESSPDVDVQMEQFIRVPMAVEGVFSFGILICVDCCKSLARFEGPICVCSH
jgi:hypothetical protein